MSGSRHGSGELERVLHGTLLTDCGYFRSAGSWIPVRTVKAEFWTSNPRTRNNQGRTQDTNFP